MVTHIQTFAKYEGPHEQLATTLKMLESGVQQRGWGNSPPTLYRICEMSDRAKEETFADEIEAGTEVCYYGVSGFPLIGRLGSPDIIHELMTLAAMFESPLAALIATRMHDPEQGPVIAHVLITEGWWHPEDAEYADFARRGITDIRDMPNTIRARMTLCLIGDDQLTLRRDYGKPPLWLAPIESSDTAGEPRMLDLLSRIHKADVRVWQEVFSKK